MLQDQIFKLFFAMTLCISKLTLSSILPVRLIDCSKQLAAHNITRSEKTMFLNPVLHECIREHPYDTQYLPLRVGQPRTRIEMTYNFFFTNLLLFESDGTIGFKAFLRFEWQDLNLAWNTSQLPLNKVRLHYREVWTPLFSLANCETDLCHIVPHNRTTVGVENDGSVTFVVQIKQFATCVMNLKAFPYDVECCQLLFYLIDYKDSEVRLQSTFDQTEYFKFSSEEWRLESISDFPFLYPLNRYNRSYKNSKVWNFANNHTILTGTTGFKVILCFTRHVGYYFYNLITPVLIIVSIGFFTVFLPPFSGDKINLAVTSLLGFLFVQEIIAELMPKSESIPCLAIYVVRALLVSTFNVAACSCIVAVYNLPKERRPPILVRVILVRIIGGVLYGPYAIVWNLMCVQHHRLCFKPRVSNMLRASMARHTNHFVDTNHTFQLWRANRHTRETLSNHLEKLPSGDLSQDHLSQSPSKTFNGTLYPPVTGTTSILWKSQCTILPPFSPSHSDRHKECSPIETVIEELPKATSTTGEVAEFADALDFLDASASNAVFQQSQQEQLQQNHHQQQQEPKDASWNEKEVRQSCHGALTLAPEQEPENASTRTQSVREPNAVSKYIGLGDESWQDVARVMNMINSVAYVVASGNIFIKYFLPILPNTEMHGKCPTD